MSTALRPLDSCTFCALAAASRALAALALLAAATLGGCGDLREEGPALEAWIADETVTLTDRSRVEEDASLFDTLEGKLNLFAAANETVAVQLVVSAGDAPVEDLRLNLPDLRGGDDRRIGVESFAVFRARPVAVRAYPAWYLLMAEQPPRPAGIYDALVPVPADGSRGLPGRMDPGERIVLWIDLAVPAAQPAGTYRGYLSVTGLEPQPYGQPPRRRSWGANVELEVYDFVLPDAPAVAAACGFDHRELFAGLVRRENGEPYVPAGIDRQHPLFREGLMALRQLMRTGRRHGVDLFEKSLHPRLGRDRQGRVELDFTDWDAIVGPYLDGTAYEDGLGCFAWPSPVHAGWPDPADYLAAPGAWEPTCRGALAATEAHLREFDPRRAVFTWPIRRGSFPEPASPAAARSELAMWLDWAGTDGEVLVQRPPGRAAEAAIDGVLAGAEANAVRAVALWGGAIEPPPPTADAEAADRPRRWVQPAEPPQFPSLELVSPAADVRAIPWVSWRYGCEAVFLPECLHWGAGGQTRIPRDARPRLFYPGRAWGLSEAVPSARLKRLRRGLQDVQYLALLERRSRGEIAEAMVSALVRYAGRDAAAGGDIHDARLFGWVRDASAWRQARRILAEEVQYAVRPQSFSQRRLLALRLAWKQFNETVRRVRVEGVRGRIEPAGGSWRLGVEVDLFNEQGRDDVIRLSPRSLPAEFQAAGSASQPLELPLPSGARRTARLELIGEELRISPGGKCPVELLLESRHRGSRALTAVAAVVRAARAEAIEIDGDLGDWPRDPAARAGGFRLLGRRGLGAGGLAERQTEAFFARDDTHLYVAMRCGQQSPREIVARTDTLVESDRRLLVGEDLVELLLDPGRAASEAAELYHLIVKPTGVVIAERGVRSDPPLGPARPWPLRVRCATAVDATGWQVEMAIPLEDLGERALDALWGLNVCRYATPGAESSSWSPCRRHVYDPATMGTLLMDAAGEAD